MKLGSFTIVAIGDGDFQLATDQLLVDKTPGEARTILAAGHQPAVQPTSVNTYLIDTGSKRIPIDTGGGRFFGPALGKFLADLKAAGYRPEDIDEVLFTHLHPDLVGGLSIDGRMASPNATVRLEEAEQADWLDKTNAGKVDDSAKGSFDAAAVSLALYSAAGRVSLSKPGAILAPEITAVALPAHPVPGAERGQNDADMGRRPARRRGATKGSDRHDPVRLCPGPEHSAVACAS